MQLPRSLQNRWWVVFASAAGLTVGTGSILAINFAVFVRPVTEELGWSRGAFSAALLVMGLVTVVVQPIFGTLMDRYGIKQASLPMIVILSVAVAAMSLMGPSLIVMYLIYALAATGGAAQAPPMYSKAVSMWFDKERGIALGFATSGSAIGTIVIPLLTQYLLVHFGWRGAYLGLGITNFVVAFAMVGIFIREPPGYRLNRPRAQAAVAGIAPGGIDPPGVALGMALKSWRFWALTLTFTLGAIAINGTLAHIVALLIDRGWNPGAAVGALSASGLAVICGRLLGGWLLDRSTRPLVPSLLLFVPAIGCALLASHLAGSWPVLGVMALGFGVGAEIDMMGFFVSRYFGLRAFGQILGTSFAGFAVGVGAGPVLMGMSYDTTHSYYTALVANVGIMVLATLFLATLGPYVYKKGEYERALVLAGAEA